MSETFIADMRQFTDPDDPDHVVPRPAIRIRRFLGGIVEAATTATPGALAQTGQRCRRRPGRKPCPGPLQVMLTEVPPQIRWLCPACGDNGIITHWRGTPWDRTARRPATAADGGFPEVLLTGGEYRALEQIEILDEASRAIVKRGRPAAGGIVLEATEEELQDLFGFVAAEASHEKRASRRAMLRGILGRLQREIQPLGGDSHP